MLDIFDAGFCLNIKGNLHTCYPFYERMVTCMDRNFKQSVCQPDIDDMDECYNKTKLIGSMIQIQDELRMKRYIRVPRYDSAKDEFVYKDGTVVKGSDQIFSSIPWQS